ncbi:UNVERIFIED_CONTAM: putative lysophospholipase BODYGUARD 3 [Sesamum radiatum]|uniref:Lysophospholipase BODYGUARD 3 n=1 Tax=Sesamum radiatum TaxID=300843 RepID=A0AAW2JQK7_SESRA
MEAVLLFVRERCNSQRWQDLGFGAGESKIVRVSSSRLQLEEISDTLYQRPRWCLRSRNLLSYVRQRDKKADGATFIPRSPSIRPSSRCCKAGSRGTKRFLFLDGRIAIAKLAHLGLRLAKKLFSSKLMELETTCEKTSCSYTDSYRPRLSGPRHSTQTSPMDLLGFGRSPKPTDSLYTLREHVDMIERSVLEAYKVKSFHIVAHSLGCILALALAVKHPGSVKSLTLLAPPYFPTPKGEKATQYMMRRVAPRRVWPVIAFGASIACWYEHISRTICLVICKNHRLWEFLAKLLTRNRMRTYLMEGFFLHTHNAAWHTLHNIICGTAGKIEGYLEELKTRLKCDITIFHGRDDELIPVECSYNMQSRIPRAHVKVFEKKDHITIVVGRQKAFARELEGIWKNATS